MALWVCTADGVAYSVGAPACPQCGATSHVEQGSEEHLSMPKITKHGGPTVAPGQELAGERGPELVEPGQVAPAVDEANPEAPDYDSWTLTQLRTELTGRGFFPTSGNKPDLAARLRAADQDGERS